MASHRARNILRSTCHFAYDRVKLLAGFCAPVDDGQKASDVILHNPRDQHASQPTVAIQEWADEVNDILEKLRRGNHSVLDTRHSHRVILIDGSMKRGRDIASVHEEASVTVDWDRSEAVLHGTAVLEYGPLHHNRVSVQD
jgi:hypothetical protein